MYRVTLQNLPCNTPAILQFRLKSIDGSPVRVHTKVVGVVPDTSVMVSWDGSAGWAGVQDVLKENEPVILRIVDSKDAKGKVVALMTNIRRIMHEPCRIVFLDYPNKSNIQLADIRSGSRIKVDVPAVLIDVVTGKPILEGILTDISNSGCGFRFDDSQHSPLDSNIKYRIVVRNADDGCSVDIELKKVDAGLVGGMFVSSAVQVSEFIKFAAVIFVKRELLS